MQVFLDHIKRVNQSGQFNSILGGNFPTNRVTVDLVVFRERGSVEITGKTVLSGKVFQCTIDKDLLFFEFVSWGSF